MTGKCLDERKMRGMMIGGGERDRDGGRKQRRTRVTLGDGDGRLVSYKGVPLFRSNFRTSAESGCARGLEARQQ